jgi:hypothetical protein
VPQQPIKADGPDYRGVFERGDGRGLAVAKRVGDPELAAEAEDADGGDQPGIFGTDRNPASTEIIQNIRLSIESVRPSTRTAIAEIE